MSKEEIRMNKQELRVFNQATHDQLIAKMHVPMAFAPKLKIMEPSP